MLEAGILSKLMQKSTIHNTTSAAAKRVKQQ